MKLKNILLGVASVLVMLAASTEGFGMGRAADKYPELLTVESVDLSRYVGLWHQIAYLPNRFQKNCTIDTTAEYSIREDGKVGVHNECTNIKGKRKQISGKAKIVDAQTNAKLKVKFFWFAPAGDYWIIGLDEDYQYAVVGTPDRKNLWILSREPSLDRATYEKIRGQVAWQSFDVSRIQVTGKIRD